MQHMCGKAANGGASPTPNGKGATLNVVVNFPMVAAMFKDRGGTNLGTVTYDKERRKWTCTVAVNNAPAMQKLLGKSWNSHTVQQHQVGGGEMSVLFPPWILSYCHNTPDTLSVSGDLLVVFNNVTSGPHVFKETDQVDDIPWAQMSGAWSFHGKRASEIALIHGSAHNSHDEGPCPPLVEESPNDVPEGWLSYSAALKSFS
jgi:hypothetical protein